MVAILLLPAIATVYLSFNAGGYTAVPLGFAVVALLAVLAARTVLARRPLEGFGPGLLVAAGALGAYALWTLLSALWSGSPLRALVELDRVLLYLLTLLLFAALPRTAARLRLLLWSLAAAMTAVCVAALATRLAPDVLPTAANLADNARLSFPLTYWNSLGLMAALAIVLCLHLASSDREPWVAQVLGAAAVPPLAATLVLTFSRGAILALALGVVAYAALGRPRGLVSALVAVVLAAAPVVGVAYGAELLATDDPTTAAAVAQGHGLGLIVVAAAAGAGLLRALLRSVLDPRVGRLAPSRRAIAGAAVAAVVVAVAAAVVLQVPQRIQSQYVALTQSEPLAAGGERPEGGSRLIQAGSSQRTIFWSVAVDGFRASPLLGEGAGTYELLWNGERPKPTTILDAHSVYLEALGELGLVGGLLLLVAIVAVLAGSARRLRSADRALYAAVFAASLAWALHAAIDWDWEMPAVSLWVFAAGGVALAAPASEGRRSGSRPLARVAVLLVLAVASLVPITLIVSERRLETAFAAVRADQCSNAVRVALGARGALPSRPEPYEIVGYCEARAGRLDAAARDMEDAIALDPGNWRYHYGLALVQAADAQDPLAAIEEAQRLNPQDPLVGSTRLRFEAAAARGPAQLRLEAARSYLPTDLRALSE